MKAKIYLGGGVLICGAAMLFQASAATTGDIEIMVTTPRPTCNLTVRSTHDLGILPLREKKHTAFPVNIDCSGSIRTALTARNITGALQTDSYRVAIPLEGATHSEGPFLWLENPDGRNIKLTGAQRDKFCDASEQNRVCNLIPVTDVRKGVPYGKGSATIRFSIIYPA
ncbi:hypothetical protein KAM28_004485 [Salmonella enterica subsp. diarizonae serovar 47:k:z53:[z84]]|nr:hypothetical protein [Salmonella enterica subsp. diarizonae serovar 47:k:z53:[z84]]